MRIQLIFMIESGDLQQGFGQVIIKVFSQRCNHQISCHLARSPELQNYYNNWLEKYEALSNYQRGFIHEDDENNEFISEAELIAKYLKDIAECNKAFDCLQRSLNHWLKPVKRRLEQALDLYPEDEIDVVIQTQNISSESTQNILQKLPWHWWDFFNRDNFTDVAISFSDSEKVNSITSKGVPEFLRPKRVKILCVLGDSKNIDVEADRRLLRKILGAYCVFLRQPTRSEFFDFMEKERWDILFFSGHSTTHKDGKTGLLKLNATETLDIQEIRETIQFNIEQHQGMKLAIFNSCDGLGLAYQLADLDIPQIIVWREPVPDKVAQEFLKFFLNSFSIKGFSLYRSVQEARLEIQKYINKNENFPKISWLPVIHQNLAKKSITWKQLRGLPNTDIKKKKESPRETLINRVEEFWIKGVLDKSLHIEETIELGLIECSQEVTGFTTELGENCQPQNINLPEGTRAIDVFGELQYKKTLLILGKPGSGKTTALLEIAKELIDDAKQDINLLIPVVLNLSSWAGERETKSLANWLVQELNRIYQFPKEQCEAWVINQQLVLLLDGLDEVITSRRRDCIIAINKFLREYDRTEIVVSSQIKKYKQVSEKLQFQSAVFYRQLTQEQINRYFDDAGEALSRVKELKAKEEATRELIRSPLTLNFIAVAYKDKSREELSHISSLEERRCHLLDTYIERRFEEEQLSDFGSTAIEPRKIKYSEKRSLYWLNWLAQRMIQKSQKVFLIEQMQPDWLETTTQEWIYLIGSRFILGLIVSLIGVLHFGTQVTNDLGVQISLVIPSVIAGLASCLSSLVLSSLIPKIIPRFIPRQISRFIPGVMSGLIYVIITTPIVYAIVAENLNLVEGEQWRKILSPLMIDGVILGIFLSLIDREIGIIDTINRSWKKARKYSLVGLIGGSIYVLARLLFTKRYDLPDDLFDIFIELLIFLILPGLVGLLDKGKNLEQTINPNQGVWRSVKNACLFFVIFFFVGMLCSFNYIKAFHEIISIGLAVGLLAGLAGGRGPVFAGVVLIQHFMLRVILWWRGYIPWNYARFLDYATERIFLRKVGGGYIFMHRMLLEHFAQIPAPTRGELNYDGQN